MATKIYATRINGERIEVAQDRPGHWRLLDHEQCNDCGKDEDFRVVCGGAKGTTPLTITCACGATYKLVEA
jgi:hypothetical protein